MGTASRVGATAIALLLASGALAQDYQTTRERKAASPRVANRTTQRDLVSIFKPVGKIESGMFRQLHGVGLTTRPFGTELDGVCRRDAVTLWYGAAEEGIEAEDAPLRPYSIDAAPLFHVIKLPRRESEKARSRSKVLRRECTSRDSDEGANWFGASNARNAVQGLLVLEAASSAITAGTLKANSCANLFDRKMSCEAAILANADPSKIGSVEVYPAEAGTMCFVLDFDSSTKLTIKAKMSDDQLAPTNVTSIEIEQYIIVT